MGQSASGIACDQSGGKFGVFERQMFVGDQSSSFIMRISMEKVDGKYQGACIPFRSGFASGVLPMLFAPDGSMFVGGTNRGWGSRGQRAFSLQRMVWTGKVPFEVRDIHARPDGFDLTFTKPVDPKTASDLAAYKVGTHAYIYQASYGSPEVDQTQCQVEKATVAVRWPVGPPGRRPAPARSHPHDQSRRPPDRPRSKPLLHSDAYYTMNYIPKE